MGSSKQHHDKATRIRQFADTARNGDYPEWVVIAIFYQALHLVEMMLGARSEHTTSHEQRRKRLKEMPEMLRCYKPMYNYALLCRYQFKSVKASDVDNMEKYLSELERLIQLEMVEG